MLASAMQLNQINLFPPRFMTTLMVTDTCQTKKQQLYLSWHYHLFLKDKNKLHRDFWGRNFF